MAAVSVVESARASTPAMLVSDLDEVELIELFRGLSRDQKRAMLTLATGLVGPRLAPWHGHKPGRA